MRRLTETELRAAEKRLQFLLSSTPAMIYTREAEGDFSATFVSENVFGLLGYHSREFLEEPGFWDQRIHPDDAPRVFAELPTLFGKGSLLHEYRFLHKDGTYRWLRDEARLTRDQHGRPTEIAGYLIDITDRKKAENELAKHARLLAEAQQVAHLGSWDWDIGANTTTWSDEHYRIFGMKPGALTMTYEAFLRFVHPDDRQRIADAVDAARAVERPYGVEFRIRLADGRERYVYSRGVIDRDGAGRAIRMFGTVQDVTERREADAALRQSEERFATFMRNLPGAAFIRDREGRYLFANAVASKSHIQPDVWPGKTIDDVFPAETAAQLKANDRRVLETGEVLQTVETTLEKDGAHHWLVSKFPLFDGRGDTIMVGGIGLDITDRKRMEDELRESDRLLRRASEEREQLFQDLHDSIIQTIYAAGLSLEECRHLIVEGQAQQAGRIVTGAIGTLNGAIADIRKFIAGKEPPVLTGPQLRAELAVLARTIKAAQDLRFRISVDPTAASQLTTDEARHILGIAREAMSNSLRHSRAKSGLVSLRVSADRVRFEAKDDGVGFDVRDIDGRGEGLTNIAARARLLDARLEIISRPGHGCRIVLEVPRNAAHAGA